MKVLSLFDGISCGQLALNRANIKYSEYLACEINKHAIEITTKNFSNTLQIGDIRKLKVPKKIHLILAGPPCQGFSFAGKGLNFNDPRSALFFEAVKIMKRVKPKYFLFENVIMQSKFADIITGLLGVPPVEVNSSLLSAQNRRRLYWTNIKVKMPKDKKIDIQDILISRGKSIGRIVGRRINPSTGKRDDYNDKIKRVQRLEIRADKKSGALTTVKKDNVVVLANGKWRNLEAIECERLQTVPDNYTYGVPDTARFKALGEAWTVDVIAQILRGIK